MQKVIVIGCPGAGKSTFARKLQKITGLSLYYLDMLWHKPDKTNYTREEFDAKLSKIMKESSWIIDGNYIRTLKMRLECCDTVFFLDFPTEVCLEGVENRIGTKREDMPWIEQEFDEEFREWITGFSVQQLPVIYQLLDDYKDRAEIIIFKTREEMNSYIGRIEGCH